MVENKMNVDDLLFNHRIIKIWGDITSMTAENVICQLKVLEYLNPNEDVQILINSNGGEVDAGFAIIDVMKLMNYKIETVVLGKAYSMAAVIASVGDVRKATKHSKIMIHQPSTGMSGKESDLNNYVKELSKTKKLLVDILCESTKQSIDVIEKDMEHDFYLSACEAKEYGILDEIL